MKNRIIETKLVNWRDIEPLQPEESKIRVNTEWLKNSLEKYGFSMPFYGWEHKGKVYCIDGHERRLVLSEMENVPELLPVTLLEAKNRKEAVKILVTVFNQKHNRFDSDVLTDWLGLEEIEMGEIDLESVNVDFPDEIVDIEAKDDGFEMPEQDKIETDIVLGDLFEIGVHRLMCGNSTDSDSVAKLMNGEQSEISFTSPPYNTKENAKLSPHQDNFTKYNAYSDDLEDGEYLKLLEGFTKNSLLFSEYSFVNIQSLSGNKTALIDFLYNMKSFYADTLIWQKQNAQPAMAENVLNSQFEYVHVFSHKANRSIGTKKFRGTLSNVIEISKQTQNKVKVHNATFPIDLAVHFIQNFCEKTVLDLFLGSGTTMVAAHQLNRKCYGMEIDPIYCEVSIQRMLKLDPSLKVKMNGKDVTEKYLKKIEND